MAFGSPPLTGASSISTPFSWALAATSLETSGAIELISIKIVPGFAPSKTPCCPNTASFTSGEFGSMVITTSLFLATSSLHLPSCAPAATTSFTGSGLMS